MLERIPGSKIQLLYKSKFDLESLLAQLAIIIEKIIIVYFILVISVFLELKDISEYKKYFNN
tara:strand:- start:278 stop:463 length:186 start_codon:yes stop_codon:yes gene_type:complete